MKVKKSNGMIVSFTAEEVQEMLLDGLFKRLVEGGHNFTADDNIKICLDTLGTATFSWRQNESSDEY